jgi:hypothetical protein
MRLRRMEREDFVLDRVSPALRAGASDFGKTQSHQRSSPPLIRPTDVGCLRLTLLSNGTRRWAFGLRRPWLRPKPASNIHVLALNRVELCSPFPILPMVQRRSLGILPRGLDKRAHLSESEGDQNRANPQPRLTADMLPLPLGEGWGEGRFRTLYQP